MDKLRNLPPDPVEAAQVPVEGVDTPSTDNAVQAEGDQVPPRKRQAGDFPENEGLVKGGPRDAAGVEGGTGEDREAAAEAALRGRTA